MAEEQSFTSLLGIESFHLQLAKNLNMMKSHPNICTQMQMGTQKIILPAF